MQLVFDQELHDLFIQTRADLHRDLEDLGDTPLSSEAELQLRFSQDRLLARIKQAYMHGIDEIRLIDRMLKAEPTPQANPCDST